MIKGGYQIIDLKGIELDDTPVTFDGIYDKMLENVGKVCLVANVDVNDPNFDHFFVQPVMSGTTILCTVGDKTLKVNNEDGVSIEAGIIGGGSGGTSDYTDLSNKPSINDVTLSGNKSAHDLGLQGELTAGTGINIDNNVISASGDGPKITISGTINNSSSYSGFNENKLKSGTVIDSNHQIVLNCAVDLKPLITTSTYNEQVLTIPVEGDIFPGVAVYNSCHLEGVAYVWETSSQYKVYIRCVCERGSSYIQSIYSDLTIIKSQMTDPTKLVLTNKKLSTISYFTSSTDLGVGITEYNFDDRIQISSGTGSGSVYDGSLYQLYTALSSDNSKLFIKNIEIDGNIIPGAISAFGRATETYDESTGNVIYEFYIYFLGFKMHIEWDDSYNQYQYSISMYS